MGVLLLLGAGLMLVTAVHIVTLMAGLRGHTFFHRGACVLGSLGLLLIVTLVVAAIDGYSQVWAQRAGYEGQPVIYSFWSLMACTVLSSSVAIYLSNRDLNNRIQR